MHERRYPGSVSALRSPERVAQLEPERVVALCLDGASYKTVLDVGTGSGLFAEVFAAHGLTVSGLDVSLEMVQAAQQHVPGGDFRVGTAELLPYPDGAFDLVFMGVLLHEADDRRQALREAARVATARVAVLEWPYDAAASGPPMAHRISPEQIEALAASAGLRVERTLRLTHTVLVLFSPVEL